MTPEQILSVQRGAAQLKENVRIATQHRYAADTCPYCDNGGYPILPLRYAVVRSSIGVGDLLAPDALGLGLGRGITDKPESLRAHRAVVRTLRQGFVMVYSGQSRWDAYAVSAAGHLRRVQALDDPDHAAPEDMPESCVREGHHIKASFLYIEPVTRGGIRAYPEKVWIAFSPTLWSDEVRRQHEGSGEGEQRREARMQSFSIPALGSDADAVTDAFQLGADAQEATQRLQQLVLEYAAGAEQEARRSWWVGGNPVKINPVAEAVAGQASTPDLDDVRVPLTSAHGLVMRTAQAPGVAARAVAARTPSGGEELLTSAVVLRDPLGILQEINHTRVSALSDWAGFLNHPKIKHKLLVSNAITQLRETTEEAALERQKEIERGQPDRQEHVILPPYSGVPGDIPLEPLRIRVDTRKERAHAKATELWTSLQKHYREHERQTFEEHCEHVVRLYRESVERAGADYAVWWEDPGWSLVKHDFELTSAEDQGRLMEEWARVFEGGAGGDARVHAVWARATQAVGMPAMYVALFGNQEGLYDYLVPDWPIPFDGDDDKAHKAAKIYKELRGLLTFPLRTDAFEVWKKGFSLSAPKPKPGSANPIKEELLVPLKASLLRRHDAITSTLTALSDFFFGRYARNLSDKARAIGVRAVQAAVKLYENREVHLLRARLPVEQFLQSLHRAAFGASGAAMTAAARGSRYVARSLWAGMGYAGGKRAQETLIDAVLWFEDRADELDDLRQTRRPPPTAAEAATRAQAAVHAAELRVHPFSLHPGAAATLDRVKQTLNSTDDFIDRNTALWKQHTRSGTAFMTFASFFFQAWSLWDYVVKSDHAFRGEPELQLLVVGSAIACLGSVLEVVGTFMKLALGKASGVVWQRLGWMTMNFSGVLEGLQCFLAAGRTGHRGDADASRWYVASGVLFVLSALTGALGSAGGSALFGPWGIGAVLLVGAVFFSYKALTLEDGPLAIWLDRCHWGNGSRYARARHPADRPWSDAQIREELAELHGLTCGMTVDVGFDVGFALRLKGLTSPDDRYLSADAAAILEAERAWNRRIKMRLTLPGFEERRSALAWRLQIIDAKGGAVTVARGTHSTLPSPLPISHRPLSLHASQSFRELQGPTTTVFVVRPWGTPVQTEWAQAFPADPPPSPVLPQAPNMPFAAPARPDTTARPPTFLLPPLDLGRGPVRGPAGDWPVTLQIELSADVSRHFADLELTVDYVADRYAAPTAVARMRLWVSA